MPKKENSARLGKGLSAIFGEDVGNVLEDIQQGKTEFMRTPNLRLR